MNCKTEPVSREARIRSKTQGSLERYQRAQTSLAGGVSTSVRRAARPYPLYFDYGSKAHLFDVDGNRYIDYVLAWGPLILGHSPPEVAARVAAQLERGFTFGAQHDLEIEVAERLVSIIPCAAQVAFSNSGTEIVQVALRLARAATGRPLYLKFEGHYHGWDDSVLVSYRPTSEALAQWGDQPVPVGAGQRRTADAVVAQWNDRHSVERGFAQHPGEISAVICEPLLCNSGCIPPARGFLEFLREFTLRRGAVLIFDEVITGFRLALEGAQGYYGVTPDLATFGKAVGGGMPLSVLAGMGQYMDLIAAGKVVHSGTLNGNPLALAAAASTIDVLASDNGAAYGRMWRHGERLRTGMESILREAGYSVVTSGGGPVFQISLLQSAPNNYREIMAADTGAYSELGMALLDEGVLVLPDGRWYVSAAHTESDIDETLAAVRRAAAGYK